jgi:UPF0755 protein
MMKRRHRLSWWRGNGVRCVVVLVVMFFVGVALVVVFEPLRGSPAATKIRIEEGMSVAEIADLLKEKGVIRSSLAFRAVALLQGSARTLRAGTYVLSPSQTTSEILDMLRQGSSQQIIVTIPEGFTVGDIDTLFVRKGLIESGEIVKCAAGECDFSSFEFLPKPSGRITPWRSGMPEGAGSVLEGYLFPDTYYVEVESFVLKFFLERLLATFRRQVLDALEKDLKSSPRTLHEVITMASLVEREAGTDAERSVVAGILWKRFDAGMGLDVDATIRYALGREQGPLMKDDLNTSSLYNTRRYRGLPPGPISNPGLKSILAALRPEASPYWYYLHDAAGKIHYAVTNDEHNANKALYLR